MVTVRNPTFTGRSTSGIRNTSPGPFSPITRPSRNTTRRSYSRTTRIELASTITPSSTTKNVSELTTPIMSALP